MPHERKSAAEHDRAAVAEAVRDACVAEALAAYEDARIRGLCAEGAWECVIGRLRSLDVERLVRGADSKPEQPE